MKKSIKVLFTIGAASALCATPALGQISFDENGNGFYAGTVLPFAKTVDPISGIPTLTYTLPFPVAPGDLLLFEQQNTTQFSDVVRFGGPNHNQVWFFSETEAGELNPDLADVAALPQALASAVNLLENGPEGNNGVVWNPPPGSGAPGDPGTGVNLQYQIISDVPEPGSLGLVLLGSALLLVLRFRSQAATCQAR
jgi:hypothetical protein